MPAGTALMLRARLLFAPKLLEGTPYAPRPGEAVIRGDATGLYKDVHRVFGELTAEVRTELRALSADLNVIIQVRERQAATPGDGNRH